MKKTQQLITIVLICCGMQVNAQGWVNRLGKTVENAAKQQVERRLEEKTREAVDKTLEKKEKSPKELPQPQPNSENDIKVSNESGIPDEVSSATTKQPLSAASKYDFVPGDKILYYNDFSQIELGDFPDEWTSNATAEVKTINIASGKWFCMPFAEYEVFNYMKIIDLPENFIVEFDVVPDKKRLFSFNLFYNEPNQIKEIDYYLVPGTEGIQIIFKDDKYETRGYKKEESNWLDGQSKLNPLPLDEVSHVCIWMQKRRLRVYTQNQKVIDMPTSVYQGTRFNRFGFASADGFNEGNIYVSNFKITTAAPDMRSKLLTEGKFVSYGINFDVNKSEVKAESYGTLKELAQILTENPKVRIKITGHTDSDGDNAKNEALSRRRAEAVITELNKTFGIETSRLEAEGKGSTQAIAPNDTAANKSRNRRVEFTKL